MSVDPHDLIPPPVHDRVDAYVQRWVAGTNGQLYTGLINKLDRYPIGRWPGRCAPRESALLLDIGCAWGRWLVAAGQRGYCPVGIDIRLDALQAAQRVMRHHGIRGYVVAADLKRLPFAAGVFDQVYSYSVIQHVHREYAADCIRETGRVLRPEGQALLEFPVRHGLTNFRHRIPPEEDAGYESWCVRYYSFAELAKLFDATFGNHRILVDCYFGIGVRPEDADLIPWPRKAVVLLSEFVKTCARLIPPLAYLSDSVFVEAVKHGGPEGPALEQGSCGNLDILSLLRCPLSGSALEYDGARQLLVSQASGKAYPIREGIPILIPAEALPL